MAFVEALAYPVSHELLQMMEDNPTVIRLVLGLAMVPMGAQMQAVALRILLVQHTSIISVNALQTDGNISHHDQENGVWVQMERLHQLCILNRSLLIVLIEIVLFQQKPYFIEIA